MGPWGVAALIVIAAFSTQSGRSYLKKIVRSGIRAGYLAKDAAGDLAGKAKDYREELIAEIKAEHDEKNVGGSRPKETTKSSANHEHSEK